MKYHEYSWAGIATKDFDGTICFFSEAVGLWLAHCTNDSKHALFRLPSGQDFELFGPRSRWYSLQTHLVLGFEVTDIQSARNDLETQGVEFVSDVVDAPGWGMFSYFRGPDDRLYELVKRCPAAHIPPTRTVSGYSWVRLRAADYAKTVQFFAEVITLPLESGDAISRIAMFRLSAGQVLEVFGSRETRPEYVHMQGLCIGFDVKDIQVAYQDMASKGVDFITEIEQTPDGNTWAYFLGPDDQPYAIQNQTDRLDR